MFLNFHSQPLISEPLIIHAAANNNLELLKKEILEKGIHCDTCDSNGVTALYLAVKNNAVEMVKFLLEAGAEVNTTVTDGNLHDMSPLLLAVKQGNVEIVKLLIHAGADLLAKATEPVENAPDEFHEDEENETESFMVIGLKDLTENSDVLAVINATRHLKQLISTPPNLELDEKAEAETAATVTKDQYRIKLKAEIEDSLKKGASLSQSYNGNTPLHLAAMVGNQTAIEILLELGADATLKNIDLYTPLMLAVENNHLEIVKFFIEKTECTLTDNDQNIQGNTPVLFAAPKGDVHLLKYLIHTLKLSPMSLNQNKEDAIMLAASQGNLQAILYLKSLGLSLCEKNVIGGTPLMFACLSKRGLDTLKYLCKLYPNSINDTIHDGSSALSFAAKFGNAEMVKFLISRGAKVDTLNSNNETPLMIAENHLNQETFLVLLAAHDLFTFAGERPKEDDEDDKDKSVVDSLENLLKKGASVNQRGSSNQTPLHHAIFAGNESAVHQLLEAGANPEDTFTNVNGSYSAINFALMLGPTHYSILASCLIYPIGRILIIDHPRARNYIEMIFQFLTSKQIPCPDILYFHLGCHLKNKMRGAEYAIRSFMAIDSKSSEFQKAQYQLADIYYMYKVYTSEKNKASIIDSNSPKSKPIRSLDSDDEDDKMEDLEIKNDAESKKLEEHFHERKERLKKAFYFILRAGESKDAVRLRAAIRMEIQEMSSNSASDDNTTKFNNLILNTSPEYDLAHPIGIQALFFKHLDVSEENSALLKEIEKLKKEKNSMSLQLKESQKKVDSLSAPTPSIPSITAPQKPQNVVPAKDPEDTDAVMQDVEAKKNAEETEPNGNTRPPLTPIIQNIMPMQAQGQTQSHPQKSENSNMKPPSSPLKKTPPISPLRDLKRKKSADNSPLSSSSSSSAQNNEETHKNTGASPHKRPRVVFS